MCKTCGDEFSLYSELHKHQRYHTIANVEERKLDTKKDNPWKSRLRSRTNEPFRLEWPSAGERDKPNRIRSF